MEKATKENAAFLSDIIGVAKTELGEITETAWRDPYIVGFLINLIGVNSYFRFGDRAGGATGGEIVLRVWPQVTGQSVEGMSTTIKHWTLSRNAEFNDGAENAARFFFTARGKPNMDDPVTISAFESGKWFSERGIGSGGASHAGAAAVLLRNSFVDRLRHLCH